MGARIEYNTVIALRSWHPLLNVDEVLPPEEELLPEWGHPFRKSGHRVYEVGKLLPLVETKGNQQFTRVLALVKIKYYVVELTPVGIETGGVYIIKKVLTEEESAQWLKVLNQQV